MINFDLKVGFTCNNNCVHCVITDKRKDFKQCDLTTAEIEDIVSNKVPVNARINLTGGEVTIRKDFEHLIDFIHNKGFDITIQTNGTGLSDELLVERIAPKINHVLLAIHSFDENIHNKIVGDSTGIMYKKTMKAFDNLIKYKIAFATQTVISKYNIDSLYDTYKNIQIIAPGIFMHMTYPHLLGNAWTNKDIVAPKYSSIRKQISKCFKYYAKFIYTESIPKCYLYPYSLNIAHNYDDNCFRRGQSLGLDPSTPVINNEYVKDGIMLDYDKANFNDRLKGSKCKECFFNEDCPGVWKEYINIYKNELDLYPITSTSGSIALRSKDEKCINKCLFCDGGAAYEHDYDLNEFKERAQFFFKQNKTSIEITGEPCQHKELVEAIQYLSDNKKIRYIQISTHGRTFKDKVLVKQIAEAGITHARIPLYGSTKEIHEKTAASKNSTSSFDEAIEAIKNCVNEKIIICGHTLINRYNKDDINNIYDLYRKLTNNDSMLMKEFTLQFTGISIPNYSWTDGWYLPIKEYGPYVNSYLNHVDADYNKGNIFCQTIGIPYCVIGEYNGKCKNNPPKPDIGIASISKNMASKENNKIPHYLIREHFSECYNCDLIDICEGLPRNDLMLFGYYGLKAIKEQ